jgi:hypothetical protein
LFELSFFVLDRKQMFIDKGEQINQQNIPVIIFFFTQ